MVAFLVILVLLSPSLAHTQLLETSGTQALSCCLVQGFHDPHRSHLSASAGTIDVVGINSDLGRGYLKSQQVSNTSSSSMTRSRPDPIYIEVAKLFACIPYELCMTWASLLQLCSQKWRSAGAWWAELPIHRRKLLLPHAKGCR